MPILLFILLFVIILVAYPVALIWALNTLFGLGIPTTFWTWMAALLLSAPFSSRVHSK